MHESHLDEASFCFKLREAGLEAPHHTLDEVEMESESRLFAHLEGLRRGGPLVAEHLLEVVADPERELEEIAVAALGVLAAHADRAQGVQALLAQLAGAASHAQRAGLVRALGLGVEPGTNKTLVDELRRRLEGEPSQPVLLEVLAAHAGPGASPPLAEGRLAALLSSSDTDVAQAAALLARHDTSSPTLAALAATTPAIQLGQATSHSDDLRRAMLECALIHGLPGAGDWVRYWAKQAQASPMRGSALTWLALLGGPKEHAWLVWQASQAAPSRALLWALGFTGRVEAVDRCLECVGEPDLAQLAAEAICAITGVSPRDERYWLAPTSGSPEDGLPPLEQDDLEADLVPTAEDALPRPDPAALRAWWAQARASFSPGLRYLGGRPLDGAGLLAELELGSARRRSALAFELEVRSRGRALVDTRAWTWAQRASLSAAAGLAAAVDPQAGGL